MRRTESHGKEREKSNRKKCKFGDFTKCIQFRNQKITVTFHFFMMRCVHVTVVKPKQVIAPLSRCFQISLRYALRC